jgi:hypothetical protein
VLARTPRQRRIAGGQKHQVVQAGPRQTERVSFLHEQEHSFVQFSTALAAVALSTRFSEYHQLRRAI